MNYKVTTIEDTVKGFKRISIKRDDEYYFQDRHGNGLYSRLHHALGQKYEGSVFSTEKDPALFKLLTDRMEDITGEHVDNDVDDYYGYIARKGMVKNYSDGSVLNVNTKGYPFTGRLHRRAANIAHIPGTVCTLAGFAGVILAAYNEQFGSGGGDMVLAGMMYSVLEGMGGAFTLVERKEWVGPVHALGYVPAWFLAKNKMMHPDYATERFMRTHNALEKKKKTASPRKIMKMINKMDLYYEVIKEIFKQTYKQKGFSITFVNSDQDRVFERIAYLSTGINNWVACGESPDETAEPIERAEPVKLIDPWSVEIPEIENVLEVKRE